MPTVHYHLGQYISHRRAGEDFVQALETAGVRLAPSPEQADIIILHDDPMALPETIARFRDHSYLIAYSVWETPILPWQYNEALRGVQRIWTCSPFAATSFRDAGFTVDVVPHVVTQPSPGPADLEAVRQAVAYEPDRFFFYTIADSVNPRKNLEALLQTFVATFHKTDDVRLVVKQYRHSWDISHLPNVVSIDKDLPREQIAALHTLLDCYVSPHCCEAWGLSLSDAMACGKPVIATGYSGNMTFMHPDNSFPVNYSLIPVSAQMCALFPHYTPEMTWAAVDTSHLAYLMRKVRSGRYDPAITAAARHAMDRFSPAAVGACMKRLLDAIVV